jgi:hypothetical protein
MKRGWQFLFFLLSVLYGGVCFATVSAVPGIFAAPTSVNFGKTAVGSASSPHAVTITNIGKTPLVVAGINLSGTSAGEYKQTSDCGTVQPGDTCTVNVVFSPLLPYGSKAAVLAVSSNDPRKPVFNIRLSGQAPPPTISASPSTVHFGVAKVGSTPAPKAVTIRNSGSSPLTVSKVDISGPSATEFNQTSDCGTVEPGGFCTVNATFSPALPFGSKSALLTVSSNDPKKPALNMKLSGNVPPPVVSTSISKVNFGKLVSGSVSANKSVVVKNTGAGDLVVGEPAISGDNAKSFSAVSYCATVLKGESCTIGITFTPDTPSVKLHATLDIPSNDPKKGVLHLKLSGQGPPDLVATPNLVTPVVSGKGQFKNLVLSGNTLLWSDGDFGKGIWKYSTGDTSSQLLVPRLSQLSNMVVHGNYAYWINTDSSGTKFSLYRTTLDGSQTTLLTQEDAPSPRAYLAVDDKALYFTAKDPSSPATESMALQAFPLDGSTPTILYHVVKGAEGLASDENYIYVLDKTGADSFAANLVRVSKTDGSTQTLSQNIAYANGTITVANGTTYLGTYGNLVKVTAEGGTPTVLTSGGSVEPYWLVVAHDTLYWINYNRDTNSNPYSIQSMPVNGGDVTVVATNLSQPSNLIATTDGLYWSEIQTSGGMYDSVLKTLSWQTGQITDIAGGMYISSLDISGGNAYLTQYMVSEISMVSLADGLIHHLFGGVTKTTYTAYATTDNLLIGDGSALKKVSISGGVTTTLAQNWGFDINDVNEQGGTIYFTSSGDKRGVFKAPLKGGVYVALAQEPGLYGAIVSVQDGYVYYVLSQFNSSGKMTTDLRRVRLDGTAPSESYFEVPPQYSLIQFDGIGTVYLTEWAYNNDQYLKYDIVTGNVVHLLSGLWRVMGLNSSSLFVADAWNNVYQAPKTGGNLTPVISVPYPLNLMPNWVPFGDDFYIIASYLDPTKGDLSEIDYLKLKK